MSERAPRVRAHLMGWTQDLRVMVGDTSSYLSGDDTSRLVTPSEACWDRDKPLLRPKPDAARICTWAFPHYVQR